MRKLLLVACGCQGRLGCRMMAECSAQVGKRVGDRCLGLEAAGMAGESWQDAPAVVADGCKERWGMRVAREKGLDVRQEVYLPDLLAGFEGGGGLRELNRAEQVLRGDEFRSYVMWRLLEAVREELVDLDAEEETAGQGREMSRRAEELAGRAAKALSGEGLAQVTDEARGMLEELESFSAPSSLGEAWELLRDALFCLTSVAQGMEKAPALLEKCRFELAAAEKLFAEGAGRCADNPSQS